ncbi:MULTISPECIES: extracellular solute-binding protein [Micromonospora]|uniref:Sugar ABC transporter substrate-binding protein n=1 Tax=Micromonospora sicca TaxID=2202420 RepID=A0A317D0H8_9ACTN|nr:MULTISPECIES: extracellular solute-binding protein [unclassified Micromonospora]MBM0224268.1 extracellular solute-binding protein [Micromonospora sp. ATA51]PWR07994.1 sugar ABC transporter substrate-binding protein [Micromonospora sp. 4G51]
MKRKATILSGLLVGSLLLTACGGGGSAGGDSANAQRGPIKIWYANFEPEIKWAQQMIEAWNAEHPDQKITGQEVPAGKSSEEAVTAAIAAGNTPCLIFNGAQIATPDYQHMGGLVSLDSFPGAAEYIESRSGEKVAQQYKSPDGKYYQIPWKANPLMMFYNKDIFAKAGLDPDNPPLSTYQDFLSAARKVVAKGGAKYAIAPAPTNEFYQSFFDFYPLSVAESGGTLLVKDGKAQFNSDAGLQVANFWRTIYQEGLAPKDPVSTTTDPFAEGKVAIRSAGPWAISTYGKLHWGVVPVPTPNGMPANQTWTFADAKTISIYSSCKNRGTAWDVLKFATGEEQDGKFLEMTGEMPLRQGLPDKYPDYFAKNPSYMTFADQASRVAEVPFVPNSIGIWQTFRDAYVASVVFGKQDVTSAFDQAAQKVEQLAGEK